MTDRVLFTGSVEEVEPHLAWAQVLILTSDSEGLPGVILEAGAAGRAVVAVDVGGVSEAVIDGEGGFVVDRDLDQLVKALRSLDADRGLLAKMGKAGREHVRSRFGLAEVVERYRSILRDVGR
jgi:glycosyltransferase involved in cell wall biosynthesis